MNKYFIQIVILVFVSCIKLQGQTTELKYKDIFETLHDIPESEAFEILTLFQRQDPFHANTYYQLGIIAQHIAKSFDPLTDYKNLSYFTYHAKLYYGLSLKYIDEKETKKNHAHYHDVNPLDGEKKANHTQILGSLKKKISEVEEFEKKINFIRFNYFASVRNYSNSLNSFKSIVDKNSQLKNIYLTANDELITEIENIGLHFDSTIYYFDIYKQAITKFPIMNYNQSYKIDSIDTYKLDGLTKSNFLRNNIVLWDFKSWSDSVLSIINNNISQLRFDVKAEGAKIKSLSHLIELTKGYNTTYDYYTIDNKLSFRIGRYDFQPLILDIFNYQISKLNLLIGSKKPINNPKNISNESISLHNKLLFYKDLIDNKLIADKHLSSLKQNTTQFNILKYQKYIIANFRSNKGLNKYINNEPKNINKTLNNSLNNLKNILLTEKAKKHQFNDTIKSKDGNISLSILKDPLSGKKIDYYYSTSIVTDKSGYKYITGYYNTENTKAFVAKCDSMLNLKWLKKYDLSTNKKNLINNYGSHIALTGNGCISIIHTRDTIDGVANIQNWVISFSDVGKEISKNSIGPNLVPRYLIYDDINEKIIAAYKGLEFSEKGEDTDAMIVEYTDSIGRKIWETSIIFKGNLVSIIRSNEKLIVVANFTKINYKDNNITLDKSKSNAFLGMINNKGDILDIKTYQLPYSYYLTHAIKLDSETLNLLGVKSLETDLYKLKNDPKIKLFYLLLDTDGEIEYTY